MRTLLSILVLLMAARAANAGDDTGVIVTGDASYHGPIGAQIERWLRDHGHVLVSSPLPDDAIRSVLDCFAQEDENCARRIIDERAKSKTLVFTKIEISSTGNGTRNVTVTGYWFQQGREAIADRRYCERCTEQKLRLAADELMTALSRSGRYATGRLRLTSAPSGAKVVVNGQTIGVTPLDYDLSPGNHEVTLAVDRHEIETRPVAIREGQTTLLDVPLAVTSGSPGGRRSRALPLALILVGGVTAGTGGVLLAIDEDASPEGPYEINNTAPAGVALTAIGGVALVTGIWWWFRSSGDASPVASVSRKGGLIGWAGTF